MAVAFAPHALLSGERDGALRVRDPATGELRAVVRFARGSDAAVARDAEGNTELFGQPSLACVAKARVMPWAVCAERWTATGVFAHAVSGQPL